MSPPTVPHSHSRRHHLGAWVVAVMLALIFIPMGLIKLTGTEGTREMFQQWGYQPWFMYLIGAMEVAAGIAVLVPRVATYAAGFLGVEMLGALVTLVVNGQWAVAVVPIAVGALALYEMWARIPDAAGTEVMPQTARV